MNRSLHRLGRKYLNKKKRDVPKKTWKIIKGDKVQIMGPPTGKDLGKQGIVKTVLRSKNRVIVEGLNLTGQPTTVTMRWLEDGTKVRVAKTSGAIVPYPDWERDNPRGESGPNDTSADEVLRKTFEGVTLENGSMLFNVDESRSDEMPFRLAKK